MIQHTMLWNYKDDVPAEERARLMHELESLPNRVPSLLSVQWGPVVGGRNQTFSHGFVMFFKNSEGAQEYATHPEHLKFAAPFREACEMQVVVDLDLSRGATKAEAAITPPAGD